MNKKDKKQRFYLKNLPTLIRVDDIEEIVKLIEINKSNLLNHLNDHVRNYIETKKKVRLQPYVIKINKDQYNIICNKIKSKMNFSPKPDFNFLLIDSSINSNGLHIIIINEN